MDSRMFCVAILDYLSPSMHAVEGYRKLFAGYVSRERAWLWSTNYIDCRGRSADLHAAGDRNRNESGGSGRDPFCDSDADCPVVA